MKKLTTRRCVLRTVVETDVQQIHELHCSPLVDRYNTMGLPKDLAQTQHLVAEWIEALEAIPLVKYVLVIETSEGEFIGLAGISVGIPKYKDAEFWYKFHPNHWNKGYATEVVNALLDFCFTDLKLHRIKAGCAVQNTASAKVLEKCGFTREGHHRKVLPIRGEWVDNYEYAILEEDFKHIQ
jgi:[ribosomal protein S5]-alanine N-acetyltransferase